MIITIGIIILSLLTFLGIVADYTARQGGNTTFYLLKGFMFGATYEARPVELVNDDGETVDEASQRIVSICLIFVAFEFIWYVEFDN